MGLESARNHWPIPEWNADWSVWQQKFADLVAGIDSSVFGLTEGVKTVFKQTPDAEVIDDLGVKKLSVAGNVILVSRTLNTEVVVDTSVDLPLLQNRMLCVVITPGAVGQQSTVFELLDTVPSDQSIHVFGFVDTAYVIHWFNGSTLEYGETARPIFSSGGGGGGASYWVRAAGPPGVLSPVTGTDIVRIGDGDAANPAYGFLLDTNTGFYRSGDDEIGVSIGGYGSAKLRFSDGSFFPGGHLLEFIDDESDYTHWRTVIGTSRGAAGPHANMTIAAMAKNDTCGAESGLYASVPSGSTQSPGCRMFASGGYPSINIVANTSEAGCSASMNYECTSNKYVYAYESIISNSVDGSGGASYSTNVSCADGSQLIMMANVGSGSSITNPLAFAQFGCGLGASNINGTAYYGLRNNFTDAWDAGIRCSRNETPDKASITFIWKGTELCVIEDATGLGTYTTLYSMVPGFLISTGTGTDPYMGINSNCFADGGSATIGCDSKGSNDYSGNQNIYTHVRAIRSDIEAEYSWLQVKVEKTTIGGRSEFNLQSKSILRGARGYIQVETADSYTDLYLRSWNNSSTQDAYSNFESKEIDSGNYASLSLRARRSNHIVSSITSYVYTNYNAKSSVIAEAHGGTSGDGIVELKAVSANGNAYVDVIASWMDMNQAEIRDLKSETYGAAPGAASFGSNTITANWATGKAFQEVTLNDDATASSMTAPNGAAKLLQLNVWADASPRDIDATAFTDVTWESGSSLPVTIAANEHVKIELQYDGTNYFGRIVAY